VKKGWEITDETQGRFSIKIIRTTGKQQSEQEKETWYSLKGKMLCIIVKYWYRILLMDRDKLLKCCSEWQIGNPKM
jgi:hypothetical protein